MTQSFNILKEKLSAYKRKYYLNRLIKNSLIFLAGLLSLFFIVNSLEFTFNMGTTSRSILFYGFILAFLVGLYFWIVKPALEYIKSNDALSDEEAATQIGKYFPELGDKLLNTIQLEKYSNKSTLVSASIEQRSEEISIFTFTRGIDLKQNNRYAKYIFVPSVAIFTVLLFIPQFFTESTNRIVNYDKEFEISRLFKFEIDEDALFTFQNEDFLFETQIIGESIPEEVLVLANGRRHRMRLDKNGISSYTFKNVQKDFTIQLVASEYSSPLYKVQVLLRPDIQGFNVHLEYPNHTQLNNEELSNVGNLSVPQGTKINWQVQSINAQLMEVYFSDKLHSTMNSNSQLFEFDKIAELNEDYSLTLKNEHGVNKDSIIYSLQVIRDQLPSLKLDFVQDTTLYSYVLLSGLISDDYGISNLELVYDRQNERQRMRLPFSTKLNSQNFFYQWTLDSLNLNKGEEIEFFVRVWDNDGVNGRKSTQSSIFKLSVPDDQEIDEKMEKESSSAKNELDKTLKETKDLNEQIENIQNEMKSKKEVDWKDNKRIQDLVKQKENLEKDIKKLAEQHRNLMKQQEHFNEPNVKLQEKTRQLQQLMDEVLDEETKALYEELQKLLQEQGPEEQIEDMMDKIQKKEGNMEKELERAIEMFKKMQFDFKMDEIINDLDELENKQKNAANDLKDKSDSFEEAIEKQQEINEDFENVKEDLDKLEDLNQEMKNPEDLESLDHEKENVDQQMSESMKELMEKNRKKAAESQQKSSEEMKQMKEQMQNMQASMEMEMLQENLQNLRDIVDNLVKLSFDQEQIMTDFRGVNQSDPRFVTLSQQQLKLKDDAVIIEDSLLSLAQRVFQIQSFVTRELDDMNDNIEASLQSLKDRHRSEAVSHQQFAMTSINNLTLLLDDVLQQMMQQMADAMGNPQSGQKGKKKPSPALSDLQKQLNKQIQELQKSGKSGRQLSQELAELAAEQEMLRQKLQKMQDDMGQEEGGTKSGLSEAIKKMEQTEKDLVYKQLDRQTVKRQQDILTRMLEAEKSMQERELDKKRKGEEAHEIEKSVPPELEEYLKAKQKELELLHSVPAKMNPYYKEEVNKYFKRLNEQ